MNNPFSPELERDLIFLTDKIKAYLDQFKLNYEINYEEFQDIFDETWRVVKIMLKIKDVQDYVERYLYNYIRELAKNNLDENKRNKIVIITNAEG
ncbi:MAG TPA: hypothetical protein VKU94_07685 [Geobacterales bacterium]|nr:hypothetical protein [Geobacterales bacterium]